MFSCCWRKPRPRNSEDATDNDCRWKKGDKHRAYSRGGHSGAVKDLSGPPPVFYIDSGYSTNTDSNVDTVMTTSAAKLDPNSQLQRKSKLHNEKLPSFSALDRTKRPRMRREDAVIDEDNSSVVWEPLTFETFRSSSPPLAVIAPLSEARTHLHNGSQKDLADSADCHRGSKTKSRTNGGGNDNSKDSQPLPPKLTHRISIAKDGAVTFQCKGVINEGYCPDNDQLVSDKDGLSDQEASRTSKRSNPETQAPNSLYLPDSVHASSSSLSSSASVFSDDESSCVESGVDPDSLSQSQTHTQVPPPVKDQDFVTLRTETSTNDSSLQVPDSHHTQHRALGENSCAARNVNYTTGGETSLFNDGEKRTVLESIPETPSMVKRVPPKKPKRKNPPSNASTAASRDAIMKCLTSKEEQTVSSSSSSSDPKRHSDVGLRHGGYDVAEMDDVVLMPPEPFMDDHDYAEFGSFDEVNGSLV